MESQGISLTVDMSRAEIEAAGRLGASGLDKALVLNSFYLNVDATELSVGQHLANDGFYEAWITSWMTRNINSGDVCVDLGSNYGYFTRIMEILSGSKGKVHAIDANTALTNILRSSIEQFPLENSADVKIHNYAISNEPGIVELLIPTKLLGGASIISDRNSLPSSIPVEHWDQSLSIESRRLDSLDLGKINFIKIDIEGAEAIAWEGIEAALDSESTIIIEFGNYLPADFIEYIYANYSVKQILTDGSEGKLSLKSLRKLDDWVMAILRPKKSLCKLRW